jgi:hypothetical protein
MNINTAKMNALKLVRDALIETGAAQQRVAANGPTILTVVERVLAKPLDEQNIRTGFVMAEMTFMQYRFEPIHEARAAQIRALIAANK